MGSLTQKGKATNTVVAKEKVTDGWSVDSENDQSIPNGVSLLSINTGMIWAHSYPKDFFFTKT